MAPWLLTPYDSRPTAQAEISHLPLQLINVIIIRKYKQLLWLLLLAAAAAGVVGVIVLVSGCCITGGCENQYNYLNSYEHSLLVIYDMKKNISHTMRCVPSCGMSFSQHDLVKHLHFWPVSFCPFFDAHIRKGGSHKAWYRNSLQVVIWHQYHNT